MPHTGLACKRHGGTSFDATLVSPDRGRVPTTVLAAVVAGPAHAAGHSGFWPTPPPPDRIVIDVVTVNGSGCPAGTAAIAVSPDNQAFTVTYSDYLAQVGVGSKPTDFRKNCQDSTDGSINTTYHFSWLRCP